jgi:hypothetical protein
MVISMVIKLYSTDWQYHHGMVVITAVKSFITLASGATTLGPTTLGLMKIGITIIKAGNTN